MKTKIFGILAVFVFSCVSTALSHPPTEFKAAYSLEDQLLTLEAKHLTDDPDEDYLKKITVLKNGEEVKVEYFQRQRDRLNVSYELEIAAEEEDILVVKIISAEGGSKTAVLEVAAQEDGDTPKKPLSKSELKSTGFGKGSGSGY